MKVSTTSWAKESVTMYVLGIETSCDETAASIVRDDGYVLSNVVASQVPVHQKYGGVVPELASRAHLESVLPVVSEALRRCSLTASELDGIAVTQGPGLIGALMVGVHTAKGLAYSLSKPLIGVHHIEAHIAAVRLWDERLEKTIRPQMPHVALAVSGGHTHLYLVKGPGNIETLGQTLDDAAGEAFDKVASMLGLGYPGGKVIDDLSQTGDASAISFPRAWLGERHDFFSFSGLKTAVRNHLHEHGIPKAQDLADLCASFQEAVVHVLVKKTLRAARRLNVSDVVVAGGVAANSRLRTVFREQAAVGKKKVTMHIPPLRFCTDNAAMIAGLGATYLSLGIHSEALCLDATARLPITRVAE